MPTFKQKTIMEFYVAAAEQVNKFIRKDNEQLKVLVIFCCMFINFNIRKDAQSIIEIKEFKYFSSRKIIWSMLMRILEIKFLFYSTL